jgi:hypothetical protein
MGRSTLNASPYYLILMIISYIIVKGVVFLKITIVFFIMMFSKFFNI